MFLLKPLKKKYRNLLPIDKVAEESTLIPILIVPLSVGTRVTIYMPVFFFPLCLPAIMTSATSSMVKVVFVFGFIFAFGLSLSYSLSPSITFNKDQLILHHKNHLHLSAIMYDDMTSVSLEGSFLVIETAEKIYYSLPLSYRYWPRMKRIFVEHGVMISSHSPST